MFIAFYIFYLQCLFAIFYVMAGEVVSLIDFLGFTTWTFTAFIQLSVIILRFTMKDAPRSYKVITVCIQFVIFTNIHF